MNHDTLDAILQRWIDRDYLSGASYAILRGAEVAQVQCLGMADREAGRPVREDTIFRAFSNTKLPASLVALQLAEEGRLSVEAPVGEYLPSFRDMRVLRAGAQALDETEPAREPVTLRHLLTHTAGLTYPFVDPDHMLGKAYVEHGAYDRTASQAETADRLAALPLLFQPGARWNYSMATDVVGRVIEVVTGKTLGEAMRSRIFEPLGMQDTAFMVPESKRERLAALYCGDIMDPLVPGLKRVDHALPYPGAYLSQPARDGAGGGLVTTLPDYTKLLQALVPGGPSLLKPATMERVRTNQLPAGMPAGLIPTPGMGHSLACGVWVQPVEGDAEAAQDEMFWGGLAGTHWFVSPRKNIAVALMTQRWMGYGNPYWVEFRQAVYTGA